MATVDKVNVISCLDDVHLMVCLKYNTSHVGLIKMVVGVIGP